MEGQTGMVQSGKMQILNRDAIKYIAMLTMFLNHFAHVFLLRGTLLYGIFEAVGYFTAPVMCFFLVEGYQHTRSKAAYGRRLFLFALLSQIPFQLAFGQHALNMLYTLFCCFLILVVRERVSDPLWQTGLCMVLLFATIPADWPVMAPVFTMLFARCWGDKKGMALSFGVCYCIFVILNVQNYMGGQPGNWTLLAVFQAMLAGLGILAAAVAVLLLYNGKRMKRGRKFSKWFFYIFYPAHLLVLYLAKMALYPA